MTTPELEQLELLSRVDELIERLTEWSQVETDWEPIHQTRALMRRLLTRVEGLKIRLEAPLVVATFGGTGTGKSSLVNALVGSDVSKTGRQRPTTTIPVLIAHTDTEIEATGLPIDEFEVIRLNSPVLRDILIIDCPDPDTNETETTDSNLARLHRLLPHCDVLIYTSTQQKYRSARVVEELGQAAAGCRLVFVQTHADLDDDIREDWREQLSAHYQVPDLFFVDSVRAFEDQQAGHRPAGDFSRLQDLLTSQLAASQRVKIRRANLLDLIQAALDHSCDELDRNWPQIEQLKSALEDQRQKLIAAMSDQLGSELQKSRHLWERRLITAVTENWGFSPFSSLLRMYNGLGNLVASFGLFRARNSAQMALIGALQGARWLKSHQQEQDAEKQLQRVGTFGLDDDVLHESQLIVSGYIRSAKLDPALTEQSTLAKLRQQAMHVEDQFLVDAGRKIDTMIDRLANKNSRWLLRLGFEIAFLSFVVFVLFRVGKNFFYDTFLQPILFETSGIPARVLTLDFYVSAGVIFIIWSAVLVMIFTSLLRRGLQTNITSLAEELAQSRLTGGLFPSLESTCQHIGTQRSRLRMLADQVADMRSQLAWGSTGLGSQKRPQVADTSTVGTAE